jgi:hypothetical protein
MLLEKLGDDVAELVHYLEANTSAPLAKEIREVRPDLFDQHEQPRELVPGAGPPDEAVVSVSPLGPDAEPSLPEASDAPVEPSTPAPDTESPAADPSFEEAQEPEDKQSASEQSKVDPMQIDACPEPHTTEPQKPDDHELSKASKIEEPEGLRAASPDSLDAELNAFSEASPRTVADLLQRRRPAAPTAPVGMTCYAPHGRCRYTSCAQSNRCIAAASEVAA